MSIPEIPPMTDPLGKHWRNPKPGSITFTDKFAVMTQETFDTIAEYSASIPSGVYPGKIWKTTCDTIGLWLLRWYGAENNVGKCPIVTCRIKILIDTPLIIEKPLHPVYQVRKDLHMITLDKIKESRLEIARLLQRFNEYEEEIEKHESSKYTPVAPKQSGAIRRASMDVTRSLADLRRPFQHQSEKAISS